MILGCLGVLVTDGQTDEETLVVVESLSRLKINNSYCLKLKTLKDKNI